MPHGPCVPNTWSCHDPWEAPKCLGKKGIGGETNKGAGKPLFLPSPEAENRTNASCQSRYRESIVFLNLPESSGMPSTYGPRAALPPSGSLPLEVRKPITDLTGPLFPVMENGDANTRFA